MFGEARLVSMKCPDCGDHLVPHREMPGFWYSPSCGGTYVKDNSGNLFKVEISGKVETFVGDTERERHAENAKRLLDLDQYIRAKSEFDYLIDNFPEDYRGWLGSYMIPFAIYAHTSKWHREFSGLLSSAVRLNREATLNHLERFFKIYGAHIRLKDDKRTSLDLAFNPLKARTLDDFTSWLLFDGLSTFLELEHQPLTALLYQLSSEYYEQMIEGKILPVYYNRLPENLNKDAFISCENITAESNELVFLFSSFGCTIKTRKRYKESKDFDIVVISPFDTKNEITLSSNRVSHSFTLFGKWLYLQGESRFILLPRSLTQSDVWRFGGRCPYCGSNFKGIFTKVCPNPQCGRPKDY